MKPSISWLMRTGDMPAARIVASTRSTIAGAVNGAGTSSTTGSRHGGVAGGGTWRGGVAGVGDERACVAGREARGRDRRRGARERDAGRQRAESLEQLALERLVLGS